MQRINCRAIVPGKDSVRSVDTPTLSRAGKIKREGVVPSDPEA
jgi:hypothetical protein